MKFHEISAAEISYPDFTTGIIPSLCIFVDVRYELYETTLTRIPEESGFYGLNSNCYVLRNGVPCIFV